MTKVRILIYFLFISFCAASRTFYSRQMCDFDKNITDCSFQLSQADSCYVYKTKVCNNYDFSSWNLKPLYKAESEEDADFTVSILPYAAYAFDFQKDSPVSAVNISMKSSNKAISGFSFVMSGNIRLKDICRIFDFRKGADNISVPFIFYDCLNQLVEREWRNISFLFKAYPLNIELSYLVYVPPKENLTSACDWRPLVMVFNGSLPKYDVHMKFSNAPENLNITFYNVSLVDSFGVATHNKIPYTAESDMIASKFHVVADGEYSILVGIISDDKPCTVFETSSFYVGKEIKDYSLILFTILLAVVTISALFLIYFSAQWYIKNASPTSRPTLLFVYSYKRLHHEFLVMYSRYLDNQFGLKVNSIYERTGNPKKWLKEKYSESDIVVFVISPSLKTLDQGGGREGEHHWVDQLAEAKALIEDSYIGRKKICKICFPYSGEHHMPKCLEKEGPFFMLPRDLDEFLCFTFGCPDKLNILSKLFCQNHHKVLMPDEKPENDEEINEKLQSIMKTPMRSSPVLNVKNINESSLGTKIEKSEYDASNDEKNLLPLGYMLKEPEYGNLDFFSEETSANETENDDFMLYCIRKILYDRDG